MRVGFVLRSTEIKLLFRDLFDCFLINLEHSYTPFCTSYIILED